MIEKFEELNISQPLLKAVEEMGYETPTEVQKLAIPLILEGKDIMVLSKTGSGKTATFGLPILDKLDPDAPGPQALIVTPTRELAVQVDSNLRQMGKYVNHKTTAVYGQHNINTEIQELNKGVSILTGTPGRIYDHIRNKNFDTRNIRFLVLDEADRMLDMGFIDQMEQIIRTIPQKRQTMLFSATIPFEIRNICQAYMNDPETIEIESETKTVDTIEQAYYRVERNEKRTQLNRILTVEQPESCIIFCNTKNAVDQVQNFLTRKGYTSQAIHGDVPQSKRLQVMKQFKEGAFEILVATDVAARGIHISELALVVNYDVPVEKDSYVHRIGRTGRAGESGRAITLVTSDDIMSLYEIEEHIGTTIPEEPLPTEELFVMMSRSRKRRRPATTDKSEKTASAPDTEKSEGRKRPPRKRNRKPKSPEGAPASAIEKKQPEKESGEKTRPSRPRRERAPRERKAGEPGTTPGVSAGRPGRQSPSTQGKTTVQPAPATPPASGTPKKEGFLTRMVKRILGRS